LCVNTVQPCLVEEGKCVFTETVKHRVIKLYYNLTFSVVGSGNIKHMFGNVNLHTLTLPNYMHFGDPASFIDALKKMLVLM